MKRIAFIIQKLKNGGAERTISNLSLLLKDQYEIYIIVYDGSDMTYPYEGTLLDLNLPPRKGKINKALNIFHRVNAVRKIKKQYKFDCVISFMFGANIVNVLSGGKGKIVTSARNYISTYGTGPLQQIRERFIASKSDKVVALSRMVELDLNDNFGIPKTKTMTIYNPCDINRIKNMAQEKCSLKPDDSFKFVSAGRMAHQKGQWHLIRAFSEVKKNHSNAKLVILGTGELEDRLKKLADSLGLSQSIIFTGFSTNPYAYMSKCDCYVLSSLHEGLGNVILEAMACGIPVISTDCLAGPRELIAPESDIKESSKNIEICSCGILTPCDSSESWEGGLTNEEKMLADAMCMMMDNDKLRADIVEASSRRLDEFTNENIIKKWTELIG